MSRLKLKNMANKIMEKLIIAAITFVLCLIFTVVILVITGDITTSMIVGGVMLYITLAANVI